MKKDKKDPNRNDVIENTTTNITADHIFKIQSENTVNYKDEFNHVYTTEISDEFSRTPIGLIIEKEQG